MTLDFGKWAFNNRRLVNFLVAVLVLGGLISYYDMSKLEDPELKVRQAMVIATYPGASAHQVELEVVDPLEKAIREAQDIYTVQSYSYNDLCILTVELLSTVPSVDIEQHWDQLRRKVSAASASFPAGANPAVVRDDFGDVYGMFYALTGDGLSRRELSNYAGLIKREVGNIEGVSRVDIYGDRTECIYISLMQDKLANLGVLPAEVLQTLNGQNQTVYSGYYDNGTSRIRVTVSDRYRTVEDIAGLIIQGHEEDQLRLSNIATIEKGYAEPERNALTYDREQALGISISAVSGTDITKIGKAVSRRLDEIKATQLPAGVECHKVFFQPERVTSALSTFLVNLVESVLIVIAVLILTMGLRSGVIIGASLVVIVFGSFCVLYALDGTLQRVSLASFILAMGMLVDNAIVIIDGILIDLGSGKSRREAMTDIGRKTAMPLLGATLIAILAFLPIFMSPDTTGLYVRDLFIVMAVSLLLSWVLALVHVPLMADRLLPKSTPAAANTAGEGPSYEGRWYRLLSRILNFGLSHRVTVILGTVALLIVCGFCYRFLPQGFFPDMEYDQLYMEYKLPEGTNYTQVQADLDSIQNYLASRPEVTHVTASSGGTPSRYNLVRSIATPSLSYGELIIDFTSPRALVDNLEEIQRDLNARFPDAYIKLKRYNLMYKKFPIEAQFSGPDPAVLHQLSDSARAIMERSGRVRLITTDWEPKVPVLVVDYNQPVARRIGLSRSEVGTSLLSATGGIPVGSFYDGLHEQQIWVKCVDKDGRPLESLDEATVFSTLPSLSAVVSEETIRKLLMGKLDKEELLTSALQTTPLKQVSDGVHVEWEDPVVIRWNGQRAQRVQASPMPGVGTEAARSAVAKEIEALPLPAGYSLQWIGEKNASDQSMKYLFKNFPMAIVLMIAILIMLFGDYKIPVIIFCCIPMILIGVIPAVLISGKTFGFVAIVGVLGLIGMMIKNGIVLVDEIKLQISGGKEPRRALVDSALSRLRPVMMASLTTVLGMLPLLPDAMFGSMAATIMGGLLMGTVITLVIIPVLYALFFRIK
jgi:multidrug efflux pump subunit AcrB